MLITTAPTHDRGRGKLPDHESLKTFSKCLLSVSPPHSTSLDLMPFFPELLLSFKEIMAYSSYSTFVGESCSCVRCVDRFDPNSLALKNFDQCLLGP